MEDDYNLPDGNRFQRATYRILMRTINSPWFIKFAANNTIEKRRERREQRVKDTMGLMLPIFGGMLVIAALLDFHRSFIERMIFALAGLALVWFGRRP